MQTQTVFEHAETLFGGVFVYDLLILGVLVYVISVTLCERAMVFATNRLEQWVFRSSGGIHTNFARFRAGEPCDQYLF